MVLLLLPFLAIGVIALLVGLVTLKLRRRSVQRMDPVPPQPEVDWQHNVPVEPLGERPVDAHIPRASRSDPTT